MSSASCKTILYQLQLRLNRFSQLFLSCMQRQRGETENQPQFLDMNDDDHVFENNPNDNLI